MYYAKDTNRFIIVKYGRGDWLYVQTIISHLNIFIPLINIYIYIYIYIYIKLIVKKNINNDNEIIISTTTVWHLHIARSFK